jgi:hypothetical protein
MAPEQCRSAHVADARSDIYSLGCILFEIACGRRPFIAVGVGDIVAAHLHDPPPHPQQFAPDLPARLAALITCMLAKHPEARPQTMAAVSQALDDILREIDRSAPRAPAPALSPPPHPPSPIAVPEPASPFARHPAPWPAAPAAPPLASGSPQAPGFAPMVPLGHGPLPALPVLSESTTLGGSAGASLVNSRADGKRIYLALGGTVVAGAVAAIAFVLHGSPSEHVVSYADIVAARSRSPDPVAADPSTEHPPPAAGTTDTGIAPPHAPQPPAGPPEGDRATAPSAAVPAAAAPAALLDTECRSYQAARRWPALEQCADRLQPLDSARATELKARAVEEARSAPHVLAVQAALRSKNLKQARAELDQVWAESVDYLGLQRAYDSAESQEIDALATQLDSVKDASCTAYNQLLATERATNPPHVITAATRRVRCIRPACDPAPLVTRGGQQFAAGHLADSLASYEAAYACQPEPALLQKAFVVACNLRDLARAKSYWKRLTPRLRTAALGVCVRNGIDETALKVP